MRNVLALVVSLIPALAQAQGDVLLVDANGGPGVFEDIQPAVNAAADGDVILLETGVYASFVVTGKGLQIITDTGSDVHVFGSVVVQGLGAGQSVTLRGFTAATSPLFSGFNESRFTGNAGSIWVEDCTLRNMTLHDGIKVEHCGAVTFSRCHIVAAPSPGDLPTAGLNAIDSTVTLYDCELSGGLGAFGGMMAMAPPGGPGVRLVGGLLFASGSVFRGGRGGKGLKICSGGVCNCTNGGIGGSGLELHSLQPRAFVLDSIFEGGDGGLVADAANCTPGPVGTPLQLLSGHLTHLPGAARHFEATSPVREGQTLDMSLQAPPGDFAFLLGSFEVSPLMLLQFSGVLLPAEPVARLLGTVPASGSLAPAIAIGHLPASAQSLSVRLQAAFFTTTTEGLLGPPSAVVLLDGLAGS